MHAMINPYIVLTCSVYLFVMGQSVNGVLERVQSLRGPHVSEIAILEILTLRWFALCIVLILFDLKSYAVDFK